jgi:hypothetical protein
MESIDRKRVIVATRVGEPGNVKTDEDGVFFFAGDAAFNRAVLDTYKRECVKLGAGPRQLESVDLLTARVERYKARYPERIKVPDVDEGDEAKRVLAPNEP